MRVTSHQWTFCFVDEGTEWWAEYDEPTLLINGQIFDKEITFKTIDHENGDQSKFLPRTGYNPKVSNEYPSTIMSQFMTPHPIHHDPDIVTL